MDIRPQKNGQSIWRETRCNEKFFQESYWFVIKKTYPALPEVSQGCPAEHRIGHFMYIYTVCQEKNLVLLY